MIKAVIFDLDDTLISEREYIASGYKYISNLLGQKYNKDEKHLYQLLMKLFNESPKNVFNRLLDEVGITYTQNEIIALVKEYRNHLPKIEFFGDVYPCLDVLKEKGIKTGIITDGYANAQRQKLKAVDANGHFEEIIVTDELGREFWKPHPKAFEIMKEKFKVEFNEMVYVGDNPGKDFYIGSIYPINTVRIDRGGVYKNSIYLKNIHENRSVHGLNEILLFLKEEAHGVILKNPLFS
ncbi:HAD-IA family hydrolase [Alkalihalobacillus macyae]|uniref:HAD family hydrolase n=1 Tax=Guptibacillus hwajinpoensis TaxID=208199 RepID=UPI00273B859F|nr:HAD-IA family hydrolase [Alkalihalobacillus macyae]MDP4551661.1 HAD-IA family hydrolase [Alkalihalobacillus macyae]